MKGIGNQTVFRLYNELKGFENIEKHIEKENCRKLSVSPEIIKKALNDKKGREYIDLLNKYGGSAMSFFEDCYPMPLRHIYNPPIMLQYIGSMEKFNSAHKNIAIIGSRKASDYGKRVAYDLGYKLSGYDVNIISGLAYGVDVYAHMGTLDGGGFPVGVIGNGLDQVYPRENAAIYEKIKKKGLLLTEEFLFSKPAPHKFPLRNRIISGIADALIIVEAGEKSGSLITANYGLDYGKTIFAVPGGIYSEMSKGSNKLIKEGALLLDSYEDVVKELELKEKISSEKFLNISGDLENSEKNILELFYQYGVLSIEKICEILDNDIEQVISTVTALEIKGIVKNIGVNEYFVEKKH